MRNAKVETPEKLKRLIRDAQHTIANLPLSDMERAIAVYMEHAFVIGCRQGLNDAITIWRKR